MIRPFWKSKRVILALVTFLTIFISELFPLVDISEETIQKVLLLVASLIVGDSLAPTTTNSRISYLKRISMLFIPLIAFSNIAPQNLMAFPTQTEKDITMYIKGNQGGGQQSLQSGVIFFSEPSPSNAGATRYYIATASHFFGSNANEYYSLIRVASPKYSGKWFPVIPLAKTPPNQLDIAVLAFDCSKQYSWPIPTLATEKPQRNQKLYSTGYDRGSYKQTVDTFRIRTFATNNDALTYNSVFVSGNSGSPVWDEQNNLAGIVWGDSVFTPIFKANYTLAKFFKKKATPTPTPTPPIADIAQIDPNCPPGTT